MSEISAEEINQAIKDMMGEDNTNIEEPPKEQEYHYIGVVFGNKKVLTESGQPTYDLSATHYTYKTKENYRRGQIITIPTKFDVSQGMVADENIKPENIKYDLDKILEV